MDKYINPFTDMGFKLIFGQHKELLISFLNCLLKGERVIVDLTYMDKEQDEECVVTSLESWIYVLKNMEVLNHPRYSDNKIFDRLKKITDVASLSPEERDCYERDLKRYRDALSLDLTYEHILERARLSDEKLKAATESILNGAREMKSLGVSSEKISQIFNIPIEQIEKL